MSLVSKNSNKYTVVIRHDNIASLATNGIAVKLARRIDNICAMRVVYFKVTREVGPENVGNVYLLHSTLGSYAKCIKYRVGYGIDTTSSTPIEMGGVIGISIQEPNTLTTKTSHVKLSNDIIEFSSPKPVDDFVLYITTADNIQVVYPDDFLVEIVIEFYQDTTQLLSF